MVTRYSTCHFAEVMDFYIVKKVMPPVKEYTPKCSFCGDCCELVPMPHTLTEDVELTLRRWKDGDCTLDQMFDRLNKEYDRAWFDIFVIAKDNLQKEDTPKYEMPQGTLEWKEN